MSRRGRLSIDPTLGGSTRIDTEANESLGLVRRTDGAAKGSDWHGT